MLFRSYPLFRAFGIPIRVHGSLLLFLPLLALIFAGGTGLVGFAFALVLMSCVFGFVLLHELGHSVAALYYRVPVRQITLYPIGGVAGLSYMPEDPRKELVITAAGPLVNFVLAGAFALVFFLVPSFFVATLLKVNLALGIFNLLPGFPMDGGRILRALLSRRMSHRRATRIAVRVGQGTAVALGILGIATAHVMLVVIAGFVFFAAQAELRGQGYVARRDEPEIEIERPGPFPGTRWVQIRRNDHR